MKRRTGSCFVCGERPTTRDHVPPKGIFPKPWPTDLLTVPSCKKCNEGTKLDDEYFRWFVATGSAQHKEAERLIDQRVLPRFKEKPALLRAIMKGHHLVNIVSHEGRFLGRNPAFTFDRPRVQGVVEKIVRGLYFHETKTVLGRDLKVDDFVLDPTLREDDKEIIVSMPLKELAGGLFSYRYFIAPEDVKSSFWFLMFYDQVLLVTRTFT